MSMDSICILLRHGIWSLDMVYALWTWYMLLEHDICSWDMVYALGTWYTLLEHITCSCNMVYPLGTWYMLYGHGRCLLVGEEYVALEDVDMGDVFLLENNIFLWQMPSCWRRIWI